MSKVFYIASGKGGTGKSVFAVNIAATFAQNGKRTLLIDMNTGMRTLDMYLGAEAEAVYHVFDVLRNLCPLPQAVIKQKRVENLHLLAGGTASDRGELTKEMWDGLMQKVRAIYDVIIVDGAPGYDDSMVICAKEADETILIVTPENTSIRNADALEDMLIRKRVRKRRFVLNRVLPELIIKQFEPQIEEIDSALRCDMLGMISEDENFRTSSDIGVPLVTKKDSYIAANFNRIASRMI